MIFLKRLLSVFLSLWLMLSVSVVSYAVESQDKRTPAPEIISSAVDEADGAVSILIRHKLSDAETLRELVYDIALDSYGSLERLMASPEKYLAAKTRLYLEISTDRSIWHTLKEIEDTSFTISPEEILPLCENGFSVVFMRVLLASENFRDENVKKVYIFAPSDEIPLCVTEKNIIPCEVPLKFASPLSRSISLFTPALKGYIFDGWSGKDGKRINAIPEGTDEITLTAHFIPRNYEINYVLTTDITYPFGRADNTKNPKAYTVGEGAALYSIKSPVIGYTFGGWYTAADFSGVPVTEIDKYRTGDVLLYARWISDEEIADKKYQERLEYISKNHLGDPDGDGKTTSHDARYVLRAVVGLEENDYNKLKRVDYFNTNKITSENARLTLRIAVGLDDLYEILLANGLLP